MRRMIEDGLLDMERLAELATPEKRDELVSGLKVLTDDYAEWIAENRNAIGSKVMGYDISATKAMDQCNLILERLREGVDVLAAVDRAPLHGDLFAGQLPSRRSDPCLCRPADCRPVAVPALRRGGRPVHDRGRVFQLPARVGGHTAAGGGRCADPCLSRSDERREATGTEPAFGTQR